MIPLKIGLISSYSMNGIWQGLNFHQFIEQTAIEDQSGGCPDIVPDVYFFMESDVKYWRNIFGKRRDEDTAISFLADLNGQEIDQLVAGTLENLGGVPPVAITTFLPEISVRTNDQRAIVAKKAITNVMRIAVRIGVASKVSEITRTPVVQLVAGNKLEGIECRFSPGRQRDEFLIKDSFETDAYQRILSRLSDGFGEIYEESRGSEELQEAFGQLKIAFELEPGPLYLLDGPESVKRFCTLIDRGGDQRCDFVRSKVGFNLDIAHWWLKGIRPSFLDEFPWVAKRIFHSHIAGHSKRAHFGDISLTEMSTEDDSELLAWLTKVSKLDNSHFSGCVSLEFEAAPNSNLVANSLQRLVQLIESL